jgi:hypothetical protein
VAACYAGFAGTLPGAVPALADIIWITCSADTVDALSFQVIDHLREPSWLWHRSRYAAFCVSLLPLP